MCVKTLPSLNKMPRHSIYKSLPKIWFLVKPYKWTLLLSVCLVLISQIARAVLPYGAKFLIDVVVIQRQVNRLPILLAVVSLAVIIQAASFFLVSQVLAKTAEMLITDLRNRLQSHVTRLSIAYFDANVTGKLVSKIMNDVEGIRNLIGPGMLEFFGALVIAIITLSILAHRSWLLTIEVSSVQLLASIGMYKAFTFSRPFARQNNKIKAEVSGRLTESISGIRIVKGYRAEYRESQVFARGTQMLLENTLRSRVGFSAMVAINIVNFGLANLVVIAVGSRYLISGKWTPGDYIQYSAMLVYLSGPIFQMMNIGPQFTQAIAGIDQISEITAELPEEADKTRINVLPPIIGRVLAENVSFAYEKDRLVLHNITFAAEHDSITAFVGPSGAGKSTILSLLSAFYRPISGKLTIDGTDLSTVTLASYRSQLGLVLQETFLFDGSIRENILFSRPDATEELFLQACKIAYVHEFAERFPNAYDTIVGERGVMLSGGQRQRLAIARAILADPRILILDEATSSLDSESEALIQEGLKYLMKGRTTFVIAHRLSTVRSATQILLLENGKIVEQGTHDSLYALGGRYHDLYTRQYGVESNLFLSPYENN
jgi:ABC-type multidrug transport system fused ATPase/permease subunit